MSYLSCSCGLTRFMVFFLRATARFRLLAGKLCLHTCRYDTLVRVFRSRCTSVAFLLVFASVSISSFCFCLFRAPLKLLSQSVTVEMGRFSLAAKTVRLHLRSADLFCHFRTSSKAAFLGNRIRTCFLEKKNQNDTDLRRKC